MKNTLNTLRDRIRKHVTNNGPGSYVLFVTPVEMAEAMRNGCEEDNRLYPMEEMSQFISGTAKEYFLDETKIHVLEGRPELKLMNLFTNQQLTLLLIDPDKDLRDLAYKVLRKRHGLRSDQD